ncbi:hypothetical protein NDU88_002111 [Pleurodeles waltl]|uniref:Uncharacterized protein n=1 Tax=Pleurodeles waltl TaxID=8319 RepID=A0AAV7MQP4_PLEWA|nr:hypothetical protein NDU88_002111 [Pleurodeles waltl]
MEPKQQGNAVFSLSFPFWESYRWWIHFPDKAPTSAPKVLRKEIRLQIARRRGWVADVVGLVARDQLLPPKILPFRKNTSES